MPHFNPEERQHITCSGSMTHISFVQLARVTSFLDCQAIAEVQEVTLDWKKKKSPRNSSWPSTFCHNMTSNKILERVLSLLLQVLYCYSFFLSNIFVFCARLQWLSWLAVVANPQHLHMTCAS